MKANAAFTQVKHLATAPVNNVLEKPANWDKNTDRFYKSLC
jgi:hypothetical protein